ncbi:MAG: uroporphyrinogen-III C-methyltransferase [Myxococcota bacterium]
MSEFGRVVLIGAGPGDPDLITVRGARALATADVVLFDQLATDDLLDLAPARAERINVGKRGHEEPTRTQEEINALIVEHARAGRTVVRLKGGDPFVFGRGGEEVSACAEAGIAFEIVPGVSSSIAAAAYAGIPVTDRRHAASFAVVTGHKDPSKPAEQTRWRELGAAVDTLVILMGMRNLPKLVAELIAGGKSPDTPVAAVMQGTLPQQRTVTSTLDGICDAVKAAGLRAPVAVIVGDVVGLRAGLSWWEQQPLFGRRVLVTRAKEQAAELCAALRARGAIPVVEPMIALSPVEGREERAAIERAVTNLAHYTALVFTSSNAVRFFVEACGGVPGPEVSPPPVGPRTRVFCVGDTTARAALDAGMPVHLVASGRSDAEALLARLLRALDGPDERALIPRSRIGRTVIADGLGAEGVAVDSIAFYENRRPQVDDAGLRAALVGGEIDALTFSSPSTVDHFLAGLDAESREAAGRVMIAAIGRTTARHLEKVGLPATAVAARPEAGAMADALVEAAVKARSGRA